MPARINFGSIGVELTVGGAGNDRTPADHHPLKILVIADLGGKARPGAAFQPIRIDRDNFDTLPAHLGVTLRLPGIASEGDVVLPIRELEDFAPDRIWEAVSVFDEFRKLRRKLQNPATQAEAIAQVQSWDAPAAPVAAAEPVSAEAEPAGETPNLLEQMLGKPVQAVQRGPAQDEIGEFIQRTAAKYALPPDDPRQGDMIARVDHAASTLMREILHHPRFQAVEAAWRGVHFLIRRLDSDQAIHLAVLDASAEELAQDLASDDLASTRLFDLLVRREIETPGGQPWGVIVLDAHFGPTARDAEFLGRLAQIADRGQAAVLAGAWPGFVGCRSFAEQPDPQTWSGDLPREDQAAWQALRNLPDAQRIGLALPRVLLRTPYGKGSCSVEGFAFEERPEQTGHSAYLWGNAAFAWAFLIGQAFEEHRWQWQSGVQDTISDVPLAVVERSGNKEAVPCAEVLLTDKAADRLAAAGLAVVRSIRGANRVQFSSFAPLAGERLLGPGTSD